MRLDQHLHGFEGDDFSCGAVKRPVSSHVPALKLHALALDAHKGIERTEVAKDIGRRRDVRRAAPCNDWARWQGPWGCRLVPGRWVCFSSGSVRSQVPRAWP